jgi:hypothetical protein
MSVSCTIVFGARPGESLASLQAMTTTGFNEIAQAKMDDPNARLAGGTGYGSVIPGELVKRFYLVPLALRCSKPAPPQESSLLVLGQDGQNAETLALFAKYDCHTTTGDQTSGVYVVGGGMVDAIP